MASRPLPVPQVLGPDELTPEDQDAIRALARTAQEADGVEALGEQTLLDLGDPTAPVRHLLVRTPSHPASSSGQPAPLLGYAAVRVNHPERPEPSTHPEHPDGDAGTDPGTDVAVGAELVVDPAHRRRGLGAALLDAVRRTAADLGDPRPAVWAHGDLPAARALAARAGMVTERELWQMSADLDATTHDGATPDGPPRPPEGVGVRTFVVGQDEEAWLALNALAFAWHPEQGRMTLPDLEAREREPWFDSGDLLLAERDGRLVASVWMKVEGHSDAGELYVLAVHPEARGEGLGRLMTALTLHHLRGLGRRRVELFTEADNHAAVATYRAAGFDTVRVDVRYR